MKQLIVLSGTVILFLTAMFLNAWQTNRFCSVKKTIVRLEDEQQKCVDSNERLIRGIAELTSPQSISESAEKKLGLTQIPPENVLQIIIVEETGNGR